MNKLTQIQFEIDADKHRALKAIAAAGGTTIRAIMAAAVENILANDPARAEWDRDPALRAQFSSFEIFASYTRAVQAGVAKPWNPATRVVK